MVRRVGRLLVKEASEPLEGELIIPNSKYHAHRALILASLAPGRSRVEGLSDAGHVRHTIQALRHLGTNIRKDGDTFVVDGGPYHPDRPDVSVGSSGTTLYFLTGLAALADEPVRIVGQKYFQRRPIRPLLQSLQDLGVELTAPTATVPIQVVPHRPRGGRTSIAGTLSQWISGLLLLAPFATGPSVIEVEGELNERTYIDLTVRMMAEFGLHVGVSNDGLRYEIDGGQQPHATTVRLPPDVGSAAFGLAVTALHPSDVLFRGISALTSGETDHPESDLLDIIASMGLPMTRDEATGLVRVRHDGIRLQPVRVDCRTVPDMLPILSTLGTFADGTTVLENIAHVRLKESDRVSAMLQLNRMGGRLEVRDTRLEVAGVGGLVGADVSSFNDHRVLMSLAVAGSRAQGETRLTYPNAYRISYPRFLEEMNNIGVSMAIESPRAPDQAQPPDARVNPARRAAVPLSDYVRRWAAARPDEPAVVQVDAGPDDRVLSWHQLDEEADRVATALLELGVAPGERVAFQLPNWAEFVALVIATIRLGAICCPLMPIFRAREMAYMLGRSGARVLVVPGSFRGRDYAAETEELLADPARRGALEHVVVIGDRTPTAGSGGVTWHRWAELVAREIDREAVLARRPSPTSLAQLLFTSGTSGEPKGVLHRRDVLTRAAAMEVRHLGLTESDRIFIPSPLAHQTGFLYGMWLALTLGVPQILQATWDGAVGLQGLRRWKGTFVQAATPFLADLVAAAKETGERPEALRIFVATGTTVPRALAEEATRVLETAVCGAWGTTETCLGSLSAPGDEAAKVWGTDGRALEGVRLRITDDDGRVLAPGAEGNFEVSSPTLFDGYLDHPEWTAAAMTADGWYRSGDLGVVDDAGYLRITGRVKDVINRGGEKVPVAELEQLLHTHPAVQDVAIVAMPDARLGERACAYAAVSTPIDLAVIQAFLDEHRVAKQYWPERLEIVDRLPRNPAGKVQKFLLREWVRQQLDTDRD